MQDRLLDGDLRNSNGILGILFYEGTVKWDCRSASSDDFTLWIDDTWTFITLTNFCSSAPVPPVISSVVQNKSNRQCIAIVRLTIESCLYLFSIGRVHQTDTLCRNGGSMKNFSLSETAFIWCLQSFQVRKHFDWDILIQCSKNLDIT